MAFHLKGKIYLPTFLNFFNFKKTFILVNYCFCIKKYQETGKNILYITNFLYQPNCHSELIIFLLSFKMVEFYNAEFATLTDVGGIVEGILIYLYGTVVNTKVRIDG